MVASLLTVSPRALVTKNPSSGELPLDAVHDECIAASLAATRGTAQEKLWDVLSCAIDAGLGAYAIDFIREVTLDEHMSSADREEHELMDEGAALGWASQAARQALGALSGHLRAGGPDLESAGAFSSKLDVLSVAVGLLRDAVDSRVAHASGHAGAASRSDQQRALELEGLCGSLWCARQCMTAVRWALDNSWHTRPLLLARGSIEQWRAESAAHREGSFLSTLLATLGTVAHVDVAYPLASVGLALALIFLEGAHSSEALAAKLSLFGYYLLDSAASEDVAHVAATLDALMEDLGCRDLAGGTLGAMLLLDRARALPASDARAASLGAKAAELLDLSCVRDASLASRIAAAFASLGLPHEAASLCRLRDAIAPLVGGPVVGSEQALQEASVALSARLRAGLLAEAFRGLVDFCAAQSSAEARAAASGSLVGDLAAWALESDAFVRVFELPWVADSAEERALLAVLRAQASRGGALTLLPSLYLSMRGRFDDMAGAPPPRVGPPSPQQGSELAMVVRQASEAHAATIGAVQRVLGAGPAPAERGEGARSPLASAMRLGTQAREAGSMAGTGPPRSGASSLLFRSRERVETGAVSYDPDVRSPLQPASLVHAFRSAA